MKNKSYYVYILSSQKNGTLYIGVTSSLIKRVWEHKEGAVKGFSSRYHISLLVYFEEYLNVNEAIGREKYLKGKRRDYKIKLIEERNPEWKDLYKDLIV